MSRRIILVVSLESDVNTRISLMNLKQTLLFSHQELALMKILRDYNILSIIGIYIKIRKLLVRGKYHIASFIYLLNDKLI